MALPWRLKKIASRVLGQDRIFHRAKYRPKFDLAKMFEILPAELKTDVIEQNFCLADYFIRKQDGRFLTNSAKLQELSVRAKVDKPEWLNGLLVFATQVCEVGLPVYEQTILPVLTDNFWLEVGGKKKIKDVLYSARPHRFTFVSLLAQAAVFEPKFTKAIDLVLSNWMSFAKISTKSAPYISNLVVIYRLLSLTWVWHFISAANEIPEAQKTALIIKVLLILRADIEFLSPRLGHSHPNNHLLADYFAGWLIGHVYPELSVDQEFQHYEALWLSELQRQFYTDGGHFEHSVHYHELCCQMATIYFLTKRATGQSVPAEIVLLTKRVLYFQTALSGQEVRAWPFGDTTEDSLFQLEPSDGWSAGTLVEVYRAIFNPMLVTSCRTAAALQTSYWLLNGELGELNKMPVEDTEFYQFPEAGFFRLFDSKTQQALVFRTGVFPGTNFSPGHMHSDILSLAVRHRGSDIIVPPGTYSYVFDRRKRECFRRHLSSRSAQSGYVIEGQDPLGEMTGNFRGKDNGLRVRTQSIDAGHYGLLCEGSVVSSDLYDGYVRGVLNLPGWYTLVYDVLPSAHASMAHGIGWQFSSDVAIELAIDGGICAAHRRGATFLVPSCNLARPLSYSGNSDPLRGWISKSYGEKLPAPYIYYRLRAESSAACFLLIGADSKKSKQSPVVSIKRLVDDAVIIEIEASDFTDTIIINREIGRVPTKSDLPLIDGKLIHIHSTNGVVESVRAIMVKSIDWPAENLEFQSRSGPANIRFERMQNSWEAIYL